MRDHELKQRYAPWRRLVIAILLLLIVGLGWVALAQNQDFLKLLSPGASPYQTWTIGEPVTSVAFDSEGQLLAAGLAGGEIQIRRVSDGSLVKVLRWHKSEISALSFSPNRQMLASGAGDGALLWNVDAGTSQPIVQHVDIDPWLQDILFSPDGNTLAIPDREGVIHLWEVRASTLTELHGDYKSYGSYEAVRKLAFSEEGKTLTIVYENGTIQHWQLPEGRLLAQDERYTRELNGVTGVALDPNVQTFAVIWNGMTDVDVWRLSDGSRVTEFKEHRSAIWSVAFSPDSQMVASGGARSWVSEEPPDLTIRVWRVSDGEEQAKYAGHDDNIRSVVWSPDGKVLASGSDDGTVRLWQVK